MTKITIKDTITSINPLLAFNEFLLRYTDIDNILDPLRRKQWSSMVNSTFWHVDTIHEYKVYIFYTPKDHRSSDIEFYHAHERELKDFSDIVGRQPYHIIIKQLLAEEYHLYVFPDINKSRTIVLAKK